MHSGRREKISGLISQFVDTYCKLGQINRYIGLWDMKAQVHSDLPLKAADKAVLYQLEKLARQGNETRSICKNSLDHIFAEIIVLSRSPE